MVEAAHVEHLGDILGKINSQVTDLSNTTEIITYHKRYFNTIAETKDLFFNS